jgi:PAS domain S-box-containing protein
MSIRLKLTIMFLAIASIPLLFVSVLTFSNYKKSLEASHIRHLQDVVAYKADKIETYFARLKANIQVAQSYYNIKRNLPLLLRFIEDSNNPEVIEAKETLDTQLSQMQSVLNDVSDIMLVSPQGRVVYANKSGHYYKDISKAPTEAERQAFTGGKYKITFSDVYFDRVEDNKYEILVTAPAFDFNAVNIGVIAFEVDMTSIYKIIQDNTGQGETGESVIGKKIGNEVLYLSPLKADPNAALNRKITIGENIGIPIQNAVQGKTGTGVAIDYRGVRVIGAWTYLSSLDWGLATKIDASEAFTDVTNLRNLAAIILIIVIVLSSITAFSIAQSISEPIKLLSAGAEIIGSGNLDYKVGTSHKDEIGQLSRTFDKMTSDLKQTLASRDELNKEIAERRKKEEELYKLNRTLRAIGNSNQAMMHAEHESQYIQEVCDIIVKDCGHAMVWVGYAENDEAKSVRPVAHSGFEKGYLETLKITWADTERGRGPTGTAIRTGKTCFCRNMLTDPAFELWRAEALKRGYSSSIVLPLLNGDKAFGTLTIYSKEADPFSQDEVYLLTELASDLSYGIGAIRLRIARDEAEKALQLERERLDLALRSASMGVWRWEVIENKRYFDDQTCYLLGLNPSTFTGSTEEFFGVVNPDDRDKLRRALARTIEINAPYESEYQVTWPDGTVHYLAARGRLVRDDQGRPVKINGVIWDITERKRMEDELRKSRDELEIRVKERTAELDEAVADLQKQVEYRIKAQAELKEYQLHLEDLVKQRTEELVRSNKDLEQFAYVASHDLQEPLRAVSGFVELLRRNLEKSLDAKSNEYMNFSIDGAKRMQLLINGLLEYSRIGTQGKKPRQTDSKTAVDEAVARLHTSITESGAKVTADNLPVIHFDDTQLAQLFQNLIGNAIKFHSDVPPDIHISASHQNNAWRFAVRDNGIGIEPQYAQRIFMIFQRLHTRKVYPGTGIGLSICKKIVERHGGRIWVESTLGNGSAFYFTVPDIEGAKNV